MQAIACYRKALTLRPEFPDAFANLVHSLVFVCDWSNRDKNFAALRQMLAAQVRNGVSVAPGGWRFYGGARIKGGRGGVWGVSSSSWDFVRFGDLKYHQGDRVGGTRDVSKF